MKILLLLFCKALSVLSRFLKLGNGTTWPGEIMLRFYPDILSTYIQKLDGPIIIVGGTNGKTTTAKMILHILQRQHARRSFPIVHNDSGANLQNGVVSAFMRDISINGSLEAKAAVLEIDENTVPIVISNIKYQISKRSSKNKKFIIVLLNLFRDQLDRYGEVDSIARRWKEALSQLDAEDTVILNADDPQIAYLGKHLKVKRIYFGIDKPDQFLPGIDHATDSTFCPECGKKLDYKGSYFSHVGIWRCEACGFRRPTPDITGSFSPLPGLYNEYNALAAVAVGKTLHISQESSKIALRQFTPAFGRQEELSYQGRIIKIFLSKNPAGFNASLRAVLDFAPKTILVVLNDRIPDGTDVSWIWDVDFEMVPQDIVVIVSGDRAWDLGLRMKYTKKYQISNIKYQKEISKITILENLHSAIDEGVRNLHERETLYVLPTYSAMLEVRKIVTGRKIL